MLQDDRGEKRMPTPEQIENACNLIAKSRYDAVMKEGEMLANTLLGIKLSLEQFGGYDLTVAVITDRLLSWEKCKNRETELFRPESEPRHVKD